MQIVSQEWKDNQNEPIVSESDIRITIGSTDPDAVADASASDNSSLYYAETDNVLNQEIDTSPLYATMERNQWLLDGSRQIIPTTNYENSRYIGENISGDEGIFNENPIITLSFGEIHTDVIKGVTITWSTLLGEYAKEFIVTAYNGDEVVTTETVTDNISVVSSVFMDIADYDKITVEIVKWSIPYRRARIEKLLLGVELVFGKNDVVSYNYSHRVHPLSLELPHSEISFSVDNSNRMYDFYNDEGMYKYLIHRQKVKVEYGYKIGDTVEWIDGGIFYLSEWDSPQNALATSFKATDVFGLLSSSEYVKGNPSLSAVSLYDLVKSVSEESSLLLFGDSYKLTWDIDENSKNIMTYMPMPLDTHGNCLQLLANAMTSVLYQDRQGIIHIRPLVVNKTDYVIDQHNSYSKAELVLSEPVGKVLCSVYIPNIYNTASSSKTFSVLDSSKIGDSVEYVFKHENIWYNPRIDEVTSNMTATGNVYAEASVIKCTRTGEGICDLTLKGRNVNLQKSHYVLEGESGGRVIEIDNPFATRNFIEESEMPKNIATWAKAYYDNRVTLSTSWRADPRLDALDVITVVDEYGEKDVLITEVSYTYNGAFKGSCEGVVISK